MKIKPIYKHLQPIRWYTELFDKIVSNGAKRWEESDRELAHSPKPKAIINA